jgi:NADH-quinone oxidoreductase subunit N
MTGLLDYIHLASPQLTVLLTACVVLLCDLFCTRAKNAIVFGVTCLGLLIAAGLSMMFFGQNSHMLFHGLLVSDDVTHLMNFFITLTVFLSFVYAKRYFAEHEMPQGDYYVLGLFSTVGMMTLIAAHTLLTIYLGIELVSLPLYAMTAIRRTEGDGSEAAMKYFVMGAIASGMLLYGISLLYGATGKLDLQDIASQIAMNAVTEHHLLAFALVFIVAGVGFKLAAVPFHMWAPDVYEGAPTPVTLFISAAPKVAVVGMVLRLFTEGFVDLLQEWQSLVLIMALLSTGFGNLLAIAQTNLKRLFAYSAISHMGYALFGILAATVNGYAAALYYVIVYAIMSTGAFGLLALLSSNGMEIENIDDLRGLNKRHPWLAFLMMIILFSMAGVPPTVGFFTKLLVLKALIDAHLMWVAILGLVFAVIGAFYYLRIIKVMYFDAPVDDKPIQLSKSTHVIFSLNSLSLLYLGLFPSLLVSLCMSAVGG